jgi:hypothetical protein
VDVPRSSRTLRLAGMLALLAGIVLVTLLVDHPGWRSAWTWTAAGALLLAGAVPLLVVRPRPLLPTLAVLAVASLVGYVVVAAPSQRDAAASGSTWTQAPYSKPPPKAAPPERPAPRQHPTIGVSTATIEDLDSFILATGTHP